MANRRVGRPSKQVLSRTKIVEAALELLDEHGEQGYGMRDIAQRLGVRPSALYNHVSGKDDITRGIRELIGEQIAPGIFDGLPWDEGIAAWARNYRDAFAAHPPTIALLAVMPFDPTSQVGLAYDRVISTLVGQGWPRGEALSVLVALESFILGSALDAAAAPDMMDPGDRDDVPELTAAYRERGETLAEQGQSPADQAFELGLSIFIGGLRAQLGAHASGAPDPQSNREPH
ncbi:TetR/AcrR family transcriptional regulator [Leucobacter denitrificans]|uniref:TetR/AcrR family transcriptional regulator n=1 Tax=Leucobacter denitrificans TaxID=683042 RepID=A0A7G9S7F7_9MICO|nr:TetR/AcrR family transcriptional regulator C-terminal domain-containing protein [Leucobacter denitrificans]QNN63782.1 TetR/AcrR family transcriptional regulator [Leucobacter denitrificans]